MGNKFPGAWIYTGVVIATLVFLFFAPGLFRQRTYSVSLDESSAPKSFPLSQKLSGLSPKRLPIDLKTFFSAEPKPKFLIINFWATWCPPCLEELPSLEYLSRRLHNSGVPVRVISISVDDKASDVLEFYRKLPYPIETPTLHDPGGAFANQIGTRKFPETFLVSATGEIKKRWVGPEDWLSERVSSLLAGYLAIN